MNIRGCHELSRSEIDSFLVSKPVLLVGSAVSDYPPTNLPSGGTVANDILKMLAQPDTGERWPEFLWTDAKLLPFEAVLEGYPNQKQLSEILCRLFGDPQLKPNTLHAAIGEGVKHGLFSGLITTNYDLAFDNYFADRSVFTICREQDYCAWKREPARRAPYWKIHGSARYEDKDTMIYNLAHERRMDLWKRELLKELVEDQTVIFLGYSGRDFDICAEMACINTIRRSVWLVYAGEEVRTPELIANQVRLLGKPADTVVLGDLHTFVGQLCSQSIPREDRRNSTVNIRTCFDGALNQEWCLRLLDRLACPSIGIPMLRQFRPKSGEANGSLWASMYSHAGQYRKAARHVESQIATASEPRDRLTYLIDAANAWYVYGARVRSFIYFWRAKRLASSLPADPYQDACLSKVELMYWMRRARFCEAVPILALHSWIRSKATACYGAAVDGFERTSLDNLYIVQGDAERIGIATHDGFASEAKLGYISLGLHGMQTIKTRETILQLRRRLNTEEQETCFNMLKRAKNYGWAPEAWKWAWIVMWQDGLWKRRDLWHDWWRNFRESEYPLSYRIVILFNYARLCASAALHP